MVNFLCEKHIFKTIIKSCFVTVISLMLLAVQCAVPSNFLTALLIISNLFVIIRYLINCNMAAYSMRLFCIIFFQIINTYLFFKTNMLNIIFHIINPDYGNPGAGTRYSMLILSVIYFISIVSGFFVSLFVQIYRKKRMN